MINTPPTSVTGQLLTPKFRHKIYIATPCYGGMMSTAYASSLFALQKTLLQHNIDAYIHFRGNESLISRARNSFVANFLGHIDCDYLLFIDADIGFSPQTILDMLAYNKPVTVARVPLKGINWEEAFNHRNEVKSAAELEHTAMIYNINHNAEDKLSLNIDEHGFARVEMAGTALMLIKREVFNILKEKLPDLRYVNDIAGYDTAFSKDNFWLFFEPMLHPESKRYLSEDFAFCYRWRHHGGGDIYAYMKAEVTHTGPYEFR